jgi:SAM-dependent methyltransferase
MADREWSADSMTNWIESPVELTDASVWKLQNHRSFRYTDGAASERYIGKALSQTRDLSSTSIELERWIKDWPSQYHLSRLRSRLFSGFSFDKSSAVLEVGSGCGAITRYLGETFREVIAVEGSFARAKLARARCCDQANVQVLCAPLQEVKYRQTFDLIFCIGVLEYAGAYVDSRDPYGDTLDYLRGLLAPEGVLVLAIENQFGLKYFSSAAEDHTSVMFDGIEGYPRFRRGARTFGHTELKERLQRHFASVAFHYPYPDYKLPRCILSEEIFHVADVGELIGNMSGSDIKSCKSPLFDERLALLELERNNQLPFFANSFLVLAGTGQVQKVKFDQLGIFFSARRAKSLESVTRIVKSEGTDVRTHKTPVCGAAPMQSRQLTLRPCSDPWVNGVSLNTLLSKRTRERDLELDELFAPCRLWLKFLRSQAMGDDSDLLPGHYLDAVWRNCYLVNDEYRAIDLEWEWSNTIPLNVLVIRSIFQFLHDVFDGKDICPALKKWRSKSVVVRVARSFGVQLNEKDFRAFVEMESAIAATLEEVDEAKFRRSIWRFLNFGGAIRALRLAGQWFVCHFNNSTRIAKRVLRPYLIR